MSQEIVDADALALVVSFRRPIGDGGSVDFQTTVRQDIPEEKMAALMDKFHKAGKRLALWAKVELAQNKLEHIEEQEVAAYAEKLGIDQYLEHSGKPPTAAERDRLKQANERLIYADKTKASHAKVVSTTKAELGV